MPSSTRSSTPGPSDDVQTAKRPISDAEDGPNGTKKKLRIDQSPETLKPDAESSSKRDRDSKRRKKKKKKSPIVAKAPHSQNQTQSLDAHVKETRNVIIRFTSPPEASGSRSAPKSPSPVRTDSVGDKGLGTAVENQNTVNVDAPATPTSLDKGKGKAVDPTENEVAQPSSALSLEERNAQLTEELTIKNQLIETHQGVISQFQQAITCQICLDLMYKPYALAPCGHLACYDCLVQWFKAPMPDGRPAPPAVMRKKTCPHCRAIVRERPVEVWGIKGMVQSLSKSGLVVIPAPLPGNDANQAPADPWAGIFRKAIDIGGAFFPPFMPVGFLPEDEPPPQGRAADLGMLDVEDGGIYRCIDCMHEIWDGVCTSCGRVYRGHQRDEEDLGWLEEDLGALDAAEDVDMADDPGWMGLEEGDGDDEEDLVVWPQHLRRRMRVRNALIDLVDGHFEDPEEIHDIDGHDDDEDEEENESYEGSFIDDEGDIGIPRHLARPSPEVYEISDDDSDVVALPPRRRREVIELLSDDRPGPSIPRRRAVPRAGPRSSHASAIIISSDDSSERDELDSDEDTGVQRGRAAKRTRRGVVASDDDARSSDGGSRELMLSLHNHTVDLGRENDDDPELAERVAAHERELYGDDGSIPHRSVNPGRAVLSPSGDDLDPDDMAELYADEERPGTEYGSDGEELGDPYGERDPSADPEDDLDGDYGYEDEF
ncbi:hypothetical protein BV22DRAFT_1065167 [Leucogyrophana mollusca]|uniref:Uncharacterized protein n=1 Tax=Leucogyrophana mollusca TaxID=85980 RepID=A0ACB8BIN0_9AGAM|nr:hypothetical protein BV22DRAFT_1065167 [Leucogyrophana mollusca]